MRRKADCSLRRRNPKKHNRFRPEDTSKNFAFKCHRSNEVDGRSKSYDDARLSCTIMSQLRDATGKCAEASQVAADVSMLHVCHRAVSEYI